MSHRKLKVSVVWRKSYKREIPLKGGVDRGKREKVWDCWQNSLQKHAELEWFTGKLYDLAAVYFIARGAMIMDRLFLNEWESRFYVLSLSLLAPLRISTFFLVWVLNLCLFTRQRIVLEKKQNYKEWEVIYVMLGTVQYIFPV